MKEIMLCADTETLIRPEQIGLDGERLDALPWLTTASLAREARAAAKTDGAMREIWLVSCEDMDILNLAAALRRESGDAVILMVDNDPSGSFRSRAREAGSDGVIAVSELVRRFGKEKVRHLDLTQDSGAEVRECESAPVVDASTAHAVAGLESDGAICAKPGRKPVPQQATSPVPPAAAGPVPGRNAFVLSVLSGSGGAGKSTFAALAAYLCASVGLKTLLLDCDLQFGDVETLIDTKATMGFEEAVASPRDIARLPEKAPGSVCLITSPRESERAEEFAERIPLVIDEAARCFDVVIANTGSLWNEAQAALIERSARSVFLVNQSMSSLRACKRALELCQRCGIATGSFLFVLNRCSKEAPITAIDLSCALQGAQVVEMADGGRAVEECLAASMMETLVRERNDCPVSVGSILANILPVGGEDVAKAAGASPKTQSRAKTPFLRRSKSRRRRGNSVHLAADNGNPGRSTSDAVRAFSRTEAGYAREALSVGIHAGSEAS